MRILTHACSAVGRDGWSQGIATIGMAHHLLYHHDGCRHQHSDKLTTDVLADALIFPKVDQ